MTKQQKRYEIRKELDNIIKAINPAKTVMGKAAPEFVNLKDTSGKTIYLKDFKGKVVFVDFWASWCVPCRVQLPQLRNIYHKIQDKNVVFVGISLDFSLNKWKSEIRISGLDWINLTDLKVNNGTTSVEYNVTTIPHNFLIERSGIIVGENIPLDNIEIKIEELL